MKTNVTIKIGEVWFDILNRLYVYGKSIDDDELASNIQATKENEDGELIARAITTTFSYLTNALSKYLPDVQESVNNDLLSKDDNVILELETPSNFEKSARDGLAKSIHEYIVCSAIHHWLTSNRNDGAEIYIQLREEAMGKIKEFLYKRSRPKR